MVHTPSPVHPPVGRNHGGGCHGGLGGRRPPTTSYLRYPWTTSTCGCPYTTTHGYRSGRRASFPVSTALSPSGPPLLTSGTPSCLPPSLLPASGCHLRVVSSLRTTNLPYRSRTCPEVLRDPSPVTDVGRMGRSPVSRPRRWGRSSKSPCWTSQRCMSCTRSWTDHPPPNPRALHQDSRPRLPGSRQDHLLTDRGTRLLTGRTDGGLWMEIRTNHLKKRPTRAM